MVAEPILVELDFNGLCECTSVATEVITSTIVDAYVASFPGVTLDVDSARCSGSCADDLLEITIVGKQVVARGRKIYLFVPKKLL